MLLYLLPLNNIHQNEQYPQQKLNKGKEILQQRHTRCNPTSGVWGEYCISKPYPYISSQLKHWKAV